MANRKKRARRLHQHHNNENNIDKRSKYPRNVDTVTIISSVKEEEMNDLYDLKRIESYAIVIEFDPITGLPLPIDDNNSKEGGSHNNNNNNNNSMIHGIVKISSNLLSPSNNNNKDSLLSSSSPSTSLSLFDELTLIHGVIKRKVGLSNMVAWAGINSGDTKRLRGFGFVGENRFQRLDSDSHHIKLHAPELCTSSQDAIDDEIANQNAVCILSEIEEISLPLPSSSLSSSLSSSSSKNGKIKHERVTSGVCVHVNPTNVANKLCQAVLANQTRQHQEKHVPPVQVLDSNVFNSEELIAYQPNLHNGAKHLSAHMDAPLHEGFGKIITTIAIRGDATILLIGNAEDGADDDDDEKESRQPAWKFTLKEGEGYILSRNARNMCLHGVLALGNTCMRESLNMRFGLHTKEEAEHQIKIHYPDLW